MENKAKALTVISGIIGLCITTPIPALAQETISDIDRDLMLIEPLNLMTGALVSFVIALVFITAAVIIKYLILRFSNKASIYLVNYMTFISAFVIPNERTAIYQFWNGTRRMQALKMLFDVAILSFIMALCKAADLTVITIGFTVSPEFYEMLAREFVIETTGQNLSVLIISTFTIIAMIRIIEYFKYKKSI